MKYEYAPEDEGRRHTTDALARLGADFSRVGHYYFDARLAMTEFACREFALDDDQASAYIEQVEREGILPTAEQYEHDSDAALRVHRRAMFVHWMPLYRELCVDAETFAAWVPKMLEIAAPRGDVHSSRCRDHRLLGAVSTAAFAPCAKSADCPVNTIAAYVLQKTPFLPMYPEEYAAFDAERAQADALSLVQAVATRGFIDPHETREAVRDVHDMYRYLTA